MSNHHSSSEKHEYHSHKKTYIIVFVVLALLTFLELLIPGMKLEYFYHASSLTGLAIGKAFLVAYIFMHLNEETRWLKFIACIPLAAAFYATLLIVETLSR